MYIIIRIFGKNIQCTYRGDNVAPITNICRAHALSPGSPGTFRHSRTKVHLCPFKLLSTLDLKDKITLLTLSY